MTRKKYHWVHTLLLGLVVGLLAAHGIDMSRGPWWIVALLWIGLFSLCMVVIDDFFGKPR